MEEGVAYTLEEVEEDSSSSPSISMSKFGEIPAGSGIGDCGVTSTISEAQFCSKNCPIPGFWDVEKLEDELGQSL